MNERSNRTGAVRHVATLRVVLWAAALHGSAFRGAAALCVLAAASCKLPFVQQPPAEQTFLASTDNREFRKRFPNADQLFNGFDYGHAIVYETLIEHPGADRSLDARVFDFTTQQVLRHPPSVPLEEAAVGPHYATLIPEVVLMFSWAHMLHRQIYDIWAVPGLTPGQRDARVQRVLAYYQSRRDLAFSAKPKSMALMEDQPYSKTFRTSHPKFNGLLWSYHWLQMSLYDALMSDEAPHTQSTNVTGVVSQFFQMIDSPTAMPDHMPMSPGSAPLFTARYPEAAAIFDNLHALHDVVADILTASSIPRDKKRASILRAAAAYRDDTTSVVSVADWMTMSRAMTHR